MVEHMKWTISTVEIVMGFVLGKFYYIEEKSQSVPKNMVIWTEEFVYLRRRKHVQIGKN